MSDKKLRVLYVCDDDALRFKHELMLEEAGYEITWLPSNGSFRTANIRSFQAAILCQSLDWKRAAFLSAQLRRFHPSIHILRVNTLRSERENGFDVNCEIVAGPESLIEILDSLNRKQSDRAALLAKTSTERQSKLEAAGGALRSLCPSDPKFLLPTTSR